MTIKKNQQPITGLGEGDIPPYVFLCGDPWRVPKISQKWSHVEEACRVREYVVHTGVYEGVHLTAASTGVGGPSTAVMLEELAKLGAKVVIRIGNSGSLSDHVTVGDFVITTGAVRDEGTSRAYVTVDYPAAAHVDVVYALRESARAHEVRHHLGVSWSVDGFYAKNKILKRDGTMRSMSFGGYQQSWMASQIMDMKQARVLNVEMESATILTLAGLFGIRAGCICTVSDRTPWPGPNLHSFDMDESMNQAIDIATGAMCRIAHSQRSDS